MVGRREAARTSSGVGVPRTEEKRPYPLKKTGNSSQARIMLHPLRECSFNGHFWTGGVSGLKRRDAKYLKRTRRGLWLKMILNIGMILP